MSSLRPKGPNTLHAIILIEGAQSSPLPPPNTVGPFMRCRGQIFRKRRITLGIPLNEATAIGRLGDAFLGKIRKIALIVQTRTLSVALPFAARRIGGRGGIV